MNDDFINRRAAIDGIEAYYKDKKYIKRHLRILTAICLDLKRVIDTLPSADVPHWIPCSERLPYAEYGESDLVLTTCGYRNGDDTSIRWIRILYFNGGNWCFPTGETYEEKVYAWMPLPEPYKKDGEQND